MKMTFPAALALSAAALFSVAAHADTIKADGGMIVNGKGMTVYTFDKDVANSGKSTCNDGCATAWPPVMAEASSKPSGNMTIVTRDDGTKQWAYKGLPVYLFAKDTKKGDKAGDNFKDVWHIVKP
jgi:predicted lipoprotein with Yx(FWY)xxD motif